MSSVDFPLAGGIDGISNGDATDNWFSRFYADLHRMAKRELSRRGAPLSLSVTTLLHEAYLDIAGRESVSFPDQGRFMGYALRVMRGLVIDHIRSRTAIRRGAEFEMTPLDENVTHASADAKELEAISDALNELGEVEPSLAEVVDLKFFFGLSFAEIAALQKLSERTVQRRWEKARICLRHALGAAVSF